MPSSTTSVQYMSDLHLEKVKYDFDIIPSAPILLLAGDIGRFHDYDQFRDFLAKTCPRYEHVLLIAGNHEFYGGLREDGLEAAKRLPEDPSLANLHLLDRTRFHVPKSDVTILGCTLHSHIAEGYTRLTNDFARIEGWRVHMHNAEHQRDLAWLTDSLQKLQQSSLARKVVVATHYASTFEKVNHPKNEGNALEQCFCSDALMGLQKAGLMKSVQAWVFGHTHWNVKRDVEGARLLSNTLHCSEEDLSWWQKKTIFRAFDAKALLRVD